MLHCSQNGLQRWRQRGMDRRAMGEMVRGSFTLQACVFSGRIYEILLCQCMCFDELQMQHPQIVVFVAQQQSVMPIFMLCYFQYCNGIPVLCQWFVHVLTLIWICMGTILSSPAVFLSSAFYNTDSIHCSVRRNAFILKGAENMHVAHHGLSSHTDTQAVSKSCVFYIWWELLLK